MCVCVPSATWDVYTHSFRIQYSRFLTDNMQYVWLNCTLHWFSGWIAPNTHRPIVQYSFSCLYTAHITLFTQEFSKFVNFSLEIVWCLPFASCYYFINDDGDDGVVGCWPDAYSALDITPSCAPYGKDLELENWSESIACSRRRRHLTIRAIFSCN